MSAHYILYLERNISIGDLASELTNLTGYKGVRDDVGGHGDEICYEFRVDNVYITLGEQEAFVPDGIHSEQYRYYINVRGNRDPQGGATEGDIAWELFRKLAEDLEYRLMLTWDWDRVIAEHDSIGLSANSHVARFDAIIIYCSVNASMLDFIGAIEKELNILFKNALSNSGSEESSIHTTGNPLKDRLSDIADYLDADIKVTVSNFPQPSIDELNLQFQAEGVSMERSSSDNIFSVIVQGVSEDWSIRASLRDRTASKIIKSINRLTPHGLLVRVNNAYVDLDHFD